MTPPPAPSAFTRTLGTWIGVLSLAFLALTFVGRYLEQRAVVAALAPSLVAPEPEVVFSALEFLRETVSPGRYRRYERLVAARYRSLVSSKWESLHLSRAELTHLQDRLGRFSAVNHGWQREIKLFDDRTGRQSFHRLGKLIERAEGTVSAPQLRDLLLGRDQLRAHDCEGAHRRFTQLTRQRMPSAVAELGRHLADVCVVSGLPALREPAG